MESSAEKNPSNQQNVQKKESGLQWNEYPEPFNKQDGKKAPKLKKKESKVMTPKHDIKDTYDDVNNSMLSQKNDNKKEVANLRK